jgi:methyltransferase-like protein
MLRGDEMSLPEHVGKVATTTIDALRAQPLLLVVVILNAGMIFALMYMAGAQRDERQMLTKILVENCNKTSLLTLPHSKSEAKAKS